MQTLNPQQVQQVHGAGSVETALMRWYFYSLTIGGLPVPMMPGNTEY